MFLRHIPWAARAVGGDILAVVLLFGIASAGAQTTTAGADGSTGRIDFASADLPPATVEVDLSQEIFGDLFGLGDAAIAGVLESLSQPADGESSEATKLAAEQLAAGRQIVDLAKDVLREVRVRVYDKFAEEQGTAAELAARFEPQLAAGRWNRVVRAREGSASADVSLLRVGGAISGVFVVAAEGNKVILANLVCDVSPENVKNLTAAATKIGLKNGLREALEREFARRQH